MDALTDDQRRVIKALRMGGTYEGALPLFTDLSARRLGVVLRQLQRRSLVERDPSRRYTWQLTADGRLLVLRTEALQ